MKSKYALGALLCAVAAVAIASVGRPSGGHGLVAHEWGTFTSVQGADGVLLNWRPQVTAELPAFVYDWKHAGFDRVSYNLNYALKGSMVTLQRMETPVVYFYSDEAQTVDLSVKFPKGQITEWFPQASQIGPSLVQVANSNLLNEHAATNSIIHWSGIHVLAAKSAGATSALLPKDNGGSHYFAARDTDANYIQIDSMSPSKPQREYEKFLFYRGAGSFTTPLRVTMKLDDMVTVANTSKESLSHLFVLGVKGKAGSFVYVSKLLPGEEKTIAVPQSENQVPPAELAGQLSAKMSESLVTEGLYPREAAAMVNTWKDSWFAEDGLRVLYVLPRTWTDSTLPMTVNPAPKELVRVMVGRAEVLTPALEQGLFTQLDKARHGDTAAASQIRATVKSLGRFAEPAFYRAFARVKPAPTEYAGLTALLFNNPEPKPALAFE